MPHPVDAPTTANGEMSLAVGRRYWNKNLEDSRWTEHCPDFLLATSDKNKDILRSEQQDYHDLTWEQSKELVDSNQINCFQRSPVELRRYLHFMSKLKQQYGSVIPFIQQERLHWETLTPASDRPFMNPDDLKVLYNDWPYGIDRDITHLIVWTKFLLDDEPETGFLTKECHDLIEDFVCRTFCNAGIPRDKLIWFKNWKSLKSVHALEHFHVMLYQAPTGFLQDITSGDKPMSEVMGDL